MLFNSFEFLVFFLVVTFAYFLLPHRWRWSLLLGASCLFYMAFIPVYILILAFTIVVDYFAGILIEASRGAGRKQYLLLSLAANIGILAVFKYYGFATQNLTVLLNWLGLSYAIPALKIILPIGLSFHTFQAMSYTIEVYRGNQHAERHFGIYALYVMFFPQLVAGPIERPQNLIRQFHEPKRVDAARIAIGLRMMLWGLIKKVVIADQLAQVVNHVYRAPADFSGPYLVLATIFFAIQIYCDFSGYTDIAIGSAKILGFDLMTNFRRPYFATSIADFWRRWHISLSSWFRDYVYIPLGGSRVPRFRQCMNLLIVFLLSGLWHGAAWNFVIWGALHGFYLISEIATEPWRQKAEDILGLHRVPTLLHVGKTIAVFGLVCVGWVFFRADSLEHALYILKHVFSLRGFEVGTLWSLGLPRFEMAVAVASIAVLFIVDWLNEYPVKIVEIAWSNQPTRWALYLVGTYCVVFFGVFGRVEFIYFQF